MAKNNLSKYPHVDRLPGKALTIAEYAASEGVTVPQIYKRYKLGQGGFEIVVFKTLNFVIPKTK